MPQSVRRVHLHRREVGATQVRIAIAISSIVSPAKVPGSVVFTSQISDEINCCKTIAL
jgi:hypothetical protein